MSDETVDSRRASSAYVTVSEYLTIKQERNQLYIKFLSLHNELLRKEIILNYRNYDINKQKIKVFEDIIQIEQRQAIHFDPDQEDHVCEMYAGINELEPADHIELTADIEKLRNECLKLRDQIDCFNEQIPRTVNVVSVE